MLMSMLALVNRNQSMRSYFEMRIHHITHAYIQGKKKYKNDCYSKTDAEKSDSKQEVFVKIQSNSSVSAGILHIVAPRPQNESLLHP